MSALLRKHIRDVHEYLTGAASFGYERRALTGWTYPVDLEFTLAREADYYSPRDSDGLPVRRYRSAGLQYNPTRIAGFALANYNRFVTADSQSSLAHFMRAAAWFAAADDALWYYHFDWNELKAPWLSCMAQGEGISVLVRAFVLTREELYLERARQALAPLRRPIASGGVRSRIAGRWAFLEEYPSPSPAHVLNGFLFALIGIHDLMRVAPDAGDAIGFQELVETLEANLTGWDLGYWSAYDLSRGPAARANVTTLAYHRLHIAQLRYLGEVCGRSAFTEMAARWACNSESLVSRVRALSGKFLYRALVPAQR